MMYSYPYGMYRPYYSYYNRYGARAPFPTEGRVCDDELRSAKHNLGHNALQVQPSKQSQAYKQAQSQAQTQRRDHAQVKEPAHAHGQVPEQDLPKQNDRCDEKPIFDLFGIRLFSDDLLILAVLYFLYSEGVKDPELFIALILLLIS